MICNFIVAHFLSVGLLYWLAFIAMSCLQTCIQYSLRLSLPAYTKQKWNTNVYCLSEQVLPAGCFHFTLLSFLTADLLSSSTQHIWNDIYIYKCHKDHRATNLSQFFLRITWWGNYGEWWLLKCLLVDGYKFLWEILLKCYRTATFKLISILVFIVSIFTYCTSSNIDPSFKIVCKCDAFLQLNLQSYHS